MPDHKNIRQYTEPLRRAGVQNPGEVLIRDPVQLVSIVDRVDHLVRPMATPVVGFSQFVTAAGGLSATLQMQSNAGGGTWILSTGGNPGFINLFTRLTPIGGLGVPAAPTLATASLFGEGTPVNQIAVGDTAELPPSPAPWVNATANQGYLQTEPFYIPPGTFFVMMSVVTATNLTMAVMYREIPGRSDVPVA